MLESSARRPLPIGPIPRRWPPVRVGAVVALVLALGLTLAGCAEKDEDAAPEPSPTPIGRLNPAAMQVPRIDFCSLVPDSAISDAVGGKPASEAAYGNGDEATLPGIGKEVVHEIGCSWTGDDGSTARAWIFARPISPAFAKTVIGSGRRAKGCRTLPGPSYGKPASTQVCRLADGRQHVRHAGLFGQTWLSCEVSTSGTETADLRARTDRWCVEVANALDTAP